MYWPIALDSVAFDAVPLSVPAQGGTGVPTTTANPTIRKDFPDTWIWYNINEQRCV